MDTALKHKIVEKIIQSEDENVLNAIKSLFGLSDDFWTEVPAEIKQRIYEAEKELDRGEGIPHSEVMATIKNRFLNK